APAIILSLLPLAACAGTRYAQVGDVVQGRGFDPFRSETDAIKLAQGVVAYAGGWEGWEQVRFVRMREVVEVEGAPPIVTTHAWDRLTGTYRFAGTRADDGRTFSVVLDLTSLAGATFIDGLRVADESIDAALREQAMLRWR